GKDERRGYTNIGSLVYTPKPSKDGSATKAEIPASVRSSKLMRRREEEDGLPDWVEQLELMIRFEGEGHDHGGDGGLSCTAEQSNVEEEKDEEGVCSGLQGKSEEMGMSEGHENVEGFHGVQPKQGLGPVEESCENQQQQQVGKEMGNMKLSGEKMEMPRREWENMGMLSKEMGNMEMSRKEMQKMEMSRKEREIMERVRKEMENIEMSKRQYFAALIAAKEKPGEETMALAAGL
ncbi:hypothetical protein KI387_029254, partial [Taxus chinensis]